MANAALAEPHLTVADRAKELFSERFGQNVKRTDRMFAYLMVAQWIFGIVLAVVVSPYSWAGLGRTIHLHVFTAVLLGGAISSLPVALALLRPGTRITRYTIACSQMLWSALLIHLTGGRIETHFHVFGSLAFLAFYRDWTVLIPATLVVASDHFLRGVYWPESVFGIVNPERWRFLEHAGWVVFEDIFLVMSCRSAAREMHDIAIRQAEVEALSMSEARKSADLDRAIGELREKQDTLVRTEKLAAVGQLAASVGHELRNPLSAVRNATTYISKRLGAGDGAAVTADARIPQFLGIIDRELNACAKIIGDLLDFARERPLAAAPCPLRPLMDEALAVIDPGKVTVWNRIPENLPIPELDKEMIRQVLVNLVQNAVEAMPPERAGEVVILAEGGGTVPWKVVVSDNGTGIPPEVVAHIFEPLVTTKTRGTGLGLAIVSGIVQRHRGTIRVESQPGAGARFIIELPAVASAEAA